MADLSEFAQYAVPAGGNNSTGNSPDLSEFSQYAAKGRQTKPFYDAIGANMTPEMKQDHPVLAGVEQTAQDVGTVAEKGVNGLSFGLLDKGLNKAGIQPPNFDNTAPENKSGLNMIGDAANFVGGTKTLGVIGSKIVAPAAKFAAKVVPEGLKQSSYGLMNSIVRQLPKEVRYGQNAGRGAVNEGITGTSAEDIANKVSDKIKEIGGQGDTLASKVNTTDDYTKALKVIDDKIANLQKTAPRTQLNTINRLQDAKKDLLGVKEDAQGNIIDHGTDLSNMTPKEALDFKRRYDNVTQWKGTGSDDTLVNSTLQDSRRVIKEQLNDNVPGMKDWNQRYGDLSNLQSAAKRQMAYDQTGGGIGNMIKQGLRAGGVGSAIYAGFHGDIGTAAEILGTLSAKEALTSPFVKSNLAQMLNGLSDINKAKIFQAAPWVKNAINNFRQQPRPNADPVEAELMGGKGLPAPNKVGLNRALPSDAERGSGPTINQGGYVPPGLPNNVVGRTGVNPNASMGGLPDPGNIPINQPGYVPKGLPEPFLGRSGVDRPYENTGLPSPRQAGQSSGPVIKQGTSYTPPPAGKAYPQTDFGHQLKYQMQQKENVPLHPAEAGREELAKIYPPAVKGNPNIAPGDLEDFNNMKDWELSQNKGGWDISGGHQADGERVVTKSDSGHSQAFKKVSGNSEPVGFDLLRRASSGEEMTPGDQLKIKMLIHDFRKNIKPKIG